MNQSHDLKVKTSVISNRAKIIRSTCNGRIQIYPIFVKRYTKRNDLNLVKIYFFLPKMAKFHLKTFACIFIVNSWSQEISGRSKDHDSEIVYFDDQSTTVSKYS